MNPSFLLQSGTAKNGTEFADEKYEYVLYIQIHKWWMYFQWNVFSLENICSFVDTFYIFLKILENIDQYISN